jgi:chaperonin GroES
VKKRKEVNMAMTTVKPLFDHVLIQPSQAEEKTTSGIYLPETTKEKPQMGVIKAIGAGAIDEHGKTVPMIVKVGQKVMYKKWGGNEVKVNGEEMIIVEQKDILAIVE